MAIIQSGNVPGCEHKRTSPEEKAAFGFIPIFASNCLDCGEFLFRFPKEEETPKKEMEAAFDATHDALHGKPTD